MCVFCLCLCLWFLDIVPASMFGCVVIDSWTLYLPACVVVKVADACHAALCVFHHLGKLLINVWWPSLLFLAFPSVLLTFLLQTNWLLIDHNLAIWQLTFWTFDFNTQSDNLSLSNWTFGFNPPQSDNLFRGNWTFDINPPKSDNLTLDNLNFWLLTFDPPQSDKSWLHGYQVLSPGGSRGYHLWPGCEKIFESKLEKKSFFLSKPSCIFAFITY